MTKTITGEAVVLVTQHTQFDPRNPDKSPVSNFQFAPPGTVNDGVLGQYYATSMLGYIHVGYAEITISFSKEKDMLDSALASLQAKKTQVQAEAQAKLTELDSQIQNLLAISFDQEQP